MALNMTMLLSIIKPDPNLRRTSILPRRNQKPFISTRINSNINGDINKLVCEFEPRISIEEAVTPPSGWYTSSDFLDLELQRVFYHGWQVVGCTEQIKEPCDFFTGNLGSIVFVVCRDDDGNVRAFHNVCRHHASILACGTGKKLCFICPYHGWTYGLNGQLLKANRIRGIQNFDVNEFGLIPIQVAVWGPFVLLKMDSKLNIDDEKLVADEWLGSSSEILHRSIVDNSSLSYVCRREYTIECNWKVFCDNYLDGGYHVPYAHKGLASGLKLDSYSTTMYERVSIQSCVSGSMEEGKNDYGRLGTTALYAFVYPNFMINQYGPWLDTNLVVPLGPRKCKVVFDYFLEASLKHDKTFIDNSLQDSEKIQIEDVMLCEAVQRGLESPAYSVGRYAPMVETAMHHFHCLLHSGLTK